MYTAALRIDPTHVDKFFIVIVLENKQAIIITVMLENKR